MDNRESGSLAPRSMQRLALLAMVAISALGLVGGAGYLAGRKHAAGRALQWVSEKLHGPTPEASPIPSAEASIVYTEINTNEHLLDAARLPVRQAHHLEEIGGHLLFASRFGRINYIKDSTVFPLGVDVPMGFRKLRSAGMLDRIDFNVGYIRITDLLAVARDSGTYDLYVAHWLVDGNCAQNVVDVIRLTADADDIRPLSQDWRRIYASKPCVPIFLSEDKSPLDGGDESGGRLVQLSPTSIGLSVGSLSRDDELMAGLANSDLGKIVEIPLNGGPPAIYARGFRNPQGLYHSASGELWETEHGPKGGDELNLVVQGADYGWPHVSYGLSYSVTPMKWRHNSEFSGHKGYRQPVYAWVPSIGVSNLIKPDTREFPNWNHHLVVASLRGNMLRVLRLQDNRVIYDEPIEFPGHRIRDIISLSDGRIALSLEGDIMLLSNRQVSGRHARQTVLKGLDSIQPSPVRALANSPVRIGAQIFGSNCVQCHSVSGEVGAGPPLNGVIGRRVGSAEGYSYSSAMQNSEASWTHESVVNFISTDGKAYPGSAMPPMALIEWEATHIATYLAALDSDGNLVEEGGSTP